MATFFPLSPLLSPHCWERGGGRWITLLSPAKNLFWLWQPDGFTRGDTQSVIKFHSERDLFFPSKWLASNNAITTGLFLSVIHQRNSLYSKILIHFLNFLNFNGNTGCKSNFLLLSALAYSPDCFNPSVSLSVHFFPSMSVSFPTPCQPLPFICHVCKLVWSPVYQPNPVCLPSACLLALSSVCLIQYPLACLCHCLLIILSAIFLRLYSCRFFLPYSLPAWLIFCTPSWPSVCPPRCLP